MAGSTRSNAGIELPQLKALMATLREAGVIRYSHTKDGLELVFGPLPQARPKVEKPGDDPNATRRAYYEQMMNRPVGDRELELLP